MQAKHTQAKHDALPASNHILRALRRQDGERLLPHVQSVHLESGAVLFEPGDLVSHVYFPADSVIALMVPVTRDTWVEVGVVGSIGAVGMCLVLGGAITNHRALVLKPGRALRMTVNAYRKSLRRVPALFPILLRYVDAFFVQMSQTSACNGHHPFRQRLSRWLMIYRDLVGSDELPLRQNLIARGLSVRLATVSEAFSGLRAAGLIKTAGGTVRILDPDAMVATCCPCYGIINKRHARLRDEYRSLSAARSPDV